MGRPASSLAEGLYEAVWALVTPGATLAAIAGQPALLELTRVQGGGGRPVEHRVTLARTEIIAACRALDDPHLVVEPRWQGEGGAVLALLGLATGYHSAPPHRRREGAANLLGYEVGTAFKTRPGVRSHAQNAAYAVADKLLEHDIAARAAASASLAAGQRHELSALTIDLLRRYEAYYSMYTPLSSLRADLAAALELRRDGEDEMNRTEDFIASSLFAYTEFLAAKRDFMDRYKGVWVFAQADIEQGVADAIKFIEHFCGLRYREESLLRLERAEHHEFHSFTTQLEAGSEGRQALARWRERILECGCDPGQPDGGCHIHKLMRACGYYMLVLDTDWYRMVPWHHGPPPNMELVDPATLYRDIGLGGKSPW
ncbi:MAG: hypothetical protein M3065_05565 [Actinomycetota bacterium]|nr:hypothetical protein [Actinomycetota bacterium]